MNLQDYKIKNNTTCECGYKFTIKDLTKLERINDSKFYSGIVKHFSNSKCPKCQKDTVLFLKQVGQTYIVKDIAQKDIEKENISSVVEEETTGNSNEENISSNEFICPTCKKAFKNKSGLTMHTKSCGK